VQELKIDKYDINFEFVQSQTVNVTKQYVTDICKSEDNIFFYFYTVKGLCILVSVDAEDLSAKKVEAPAVERGFVTDMIVLGDHVYEDAF